MQKLSMHVDNPVPLNATGSEILKTSFTEIFHFWKQGNRSFLVIDRESFQEAKQNQIQCKKAKKRTNTPDTTFDDVVEEVQKISRKMDTIIKFLVEIKGSQNANPMEVLETTALNLSPEDF